MLTAFYHKLLSNVYKGGQCSKSLQESCWDVKTRAFCVMLDEVCKVHVQADSAYLVSGHERIGLILFTTLQELRVLK